MAYGKEYSANAVTVLVAGVVITRALAVKWKAKVDSEPFYGMGKEPLGIQDGNKSYEGEVKMHQSMLEKILAATGNSDLDGMENIDMSVSYSENGRFTQRTLVSCRFTEVGEEYKSGDKFAEIALPFIFTKVK